MEYQRRHELEEQIRRSAQASCIPVVRTVDGGNVLGLNVEFVNKHGLEDFVTITRITANFFSSKGNWKFSRVSGLQTGFAVRALARDAKNIIPPHIERDLVDRLNRFAEYFKDSLFDSGWRVQLKSIEISEFERVAQP